MRKLNIFTDFHHASLLHSLILLFEGRLGGEIYRPIGREWYEQGYWKVYDHPATVAQYLDIGGATPDGTQKLNELTQDSLDNVGIFECQDIDSGLFNKAITYRAFMHMPIDFIIASIPQHIEPFRRLADSHPNKPKLIFQIGNAWTLTPQEENMIDAILASAKINRQTQTPVVEYHQEFDTKNDFYPSFDYPEKNIYSFVNCFDISQHYSNDYWLFQQVEQSMPEWNFKIYGGQCRDGAAHGAKEVANKMRESMFIWHTKWGGDGYGHVIHNAPAVAKPLIVKKLYYTDKLAEPLLKDGETCICIDGLNYTQVRNKIEHYSQPEIYTNMSKLAYENFNKTVDFEREANLISELLENLV